MEPAGELWRVYCPEWLTVYTSHAKGEAGQAECEQARLGRFMHSNMEVQAKVVPCSTRNSERWEFMLQLLLMNRVGEYRSRPDADRHAGLLGKDAVVLERGSSAERAILRRQQW